MSMIGKSLIHYEITSEIGKGGMGEVYQAKDTKLGRDVAIKVLPEEFAIDKDRVARFQREAKLLASLNHPNIAAIYGLEEADGTHFLVMELIDGETLRDRIKAGPIPVEEALKLALQMAEALEAAHEKGVIHRDLKPANIKVTPDGKVKILDFGLAKAYVGDQEKVSLADSPTISAAATQQGVILGTAAYMSPEQAKGKPVDKRADIWAFGVVLYEMLTGRQTFTGETVSDTLASVLAREPEWNALPPNLHPRIRLMLERSLKKDPKNRYSGISDARVDIQEVLADPNGVFVQPVATAEPRKKLRVGIPWVAAALVVAGVAVWLLKPVPPPEPKQVARVEYQLPEGQQFYFGAYLPLLAVSPDGSKFVYSTNKGLFLRSMDELGGRFIAGTDRNSEQPFFSPDGEWIGFFSGTDQKLKKVAVSGGVPVTLCNTQAEGGFSWSLDNRILHGKGINILWVSANGGNWAPLIEQEGGLLGSAQMLPGREAVMYLNGSTSPFKIMVQSLKSGESKELLEGVFIQYVKTGHIVYGLENNLYAVPFDVNTLEITGAPVLLVEGVSNGTYFWHCAISDSGTLVYVPFELRTFVWVNREGKEEPLGVEPNAYWENFKISPDGARIALSYVENGNRDIWIWDIGRRAKTKITFDPGSDENPIWTPDGRQIIFNSSREGGMGIYSKSSDGSGNVERLDPASELSVSPYSISISADGKTIFFDTWGGERETDIGMLSMEEGSTPKWLLKGKYNEFFPQISPDGRWLAYRYNESGRDEIYVRPFPDVDSGGPWRVSTSGGSFPLWSPDGKELYYNGSSAINAVSVETEPTFKPGPPRSLFQNKYWGNFDIHPDGKRFLMLRASETPDTESTEKAAPKINIVFNWFEELKQRVPVD